jgi:hypothetical protein
MWIVLRPAMHCIFRRFLRNTALIYCCIFTLLHEERYPGTHCTGEWLGFRRDRDVMEKRNISCLCRESSLFLPLRSPSLCRLSHPFCVVFVEQLLWIQVFKLLLLWKKLKILRRRHRISVLYLILRQFDSVILRCSLMLSYHLIPCLF